MDLNALNNVRAWTNGVEVEYDAVAQVKNIASLPIVAGHVAIMPDVHLGQGRDGRFGDSDPRRDHSGGCRRRHRLRYVRGAHSVDGERSAGFSRQDSLGDRSARAGRIFRARQAGQHASATACSASR